MFTIWLRRELRRTWETVIFLLVLLNGVVKLPFRVEEMLGNSIVR